MPINLDKPQLWKADVSQSIDYYNDWFLRYAPETYRSQRSLRIAQVQDALEKSQNLRGVSPQLLYEHPEILPVLRMATAPPLARDRLMGLAYVSKSLIESMEGKEERPPRIPPKLPKLTAESALQSICDVIGELIDQDLFVWLKENRDPMPQELDRAVIVVADRLSGAIADPLLRNAQEQRQLAALKRWLLQRGYTEIPAGVNRTLESMAPGTFAFHMNVYVGSERKPIKMPIDCIVKPFDSEPDQLPILIEAKSAGDVTNTNKRRKEEAQKVTQLKARFGDKATLILLLCGYFDAGYLGYEASEGIDWVWEHRLDDFDAVFPPRHNDDRLLKEAQASTLYSTGSSVETQRFALQRSIDAAKLSIERNQLGQFSTPYALACQITAATLAHMRAGDSLRFLEPAVGSGVFFSALLAELGEHELTEAVGVEIDPAYFDVAESLWRERGLEVLNTNFLAFAVEPGNAGRFNLLCTNPPYVRHHHLDQAQKVALQQIVRAQLGLQVSGLAGLYVYFVLLADAVLAEGAVASWLIPTEFFTVNYGSVLRHYLSQYVTLLSIHQFDPEDVQFDDALVSSCIVTYRKRRPSSDARFLYTFGGNMLNPSITRDLAQSTIAGAQRWSFSTGQPHHRRASSELTFGDLFAVKRGMATGANHFFIITPETAAEYDIPAEFLKPILPGPRYLKGSVIECDLKGAPLNAPPLYLLACSQPPEVVEHRYPGLWAYLQTGVAQNIHERYLCASKEVWYYPEQRQPSLYLATYMGRASNKSDTPIRFYLNLSDALVTNVYLHLYPRSMLMRLLAGSRERMLELLDALNRISMADVVQNGRSYGGGLHKVEPKELITMPLLHPPDWLHSLNEKQLALIA